MWLAARSALDRRRCSRWRGVHVEGQQLVARLAQKAQRIGDAVLLLVDHGGDLTKVAVDGLVDVVPGAVDAGLLSVEHDKAQGARGKVMLRAPVLAHRAGHRQLDGAAAGVVVSRLRGLRLAVVVAADDDSLLGMRHPWHTDLHVDCGPGRGTPAPARNRESILTRLRAEAVEVAQHLLGPVGGELVMSILLRRQVGVEASLAVEETRGKCRELVVEVVGVHGGNGRRTGGRAWRWCPADG